MRKKKKYFLRFVVFTFLGKRYVINKIQGKINLNLKLKYSNFRNKRS